MPYAATHKAETRARIVQSARRLFNRHGFTEVSIDEIMSAAGLTRGGFYNHFATKEELYAEAVTQILSCNPTENWDDLKVDFDVEGSEVARDIINAYLSRRHLNDIDGLCPMIALPSDVARGGQALKAAYREVLNGMVEMFSNRMNGGRRAPRERALSVATLCVGGMVLARAVDDDGLADEIREAARNLALEIAGLEGDEAAVAVQAAE